MVKLRLKNCILVNGTIIVPDDCDYAADGINIVPKNNRIKTWILSKLVPGIFDSDSVVELSEIPDEIIHIKSVELVWPKDSWDKEHFHGARAR